MTNWMNERGTSTQVLHTMRFLPPLTILAFPSSFVLITTAVDEYFRNQWPSRMVFPTSIARDDIERKKRNIHVPKYAAGVSGVHCNENNGSMVEA
jgi:hypothetical protein